MKRSCLYVAIDSAIIVVLSGIDMTGIDTTGTINYATIDCVPFEALKAAAAVVVVSLNAWVIHTQ